MGFTSDLFRSSLQAIFAKHPPAYAALLLLIAAGAALPPGASAALLKPDKLVILSTTDVKGKTSPCGCHIPKGGLSRQASFADSIKGTYGQVLWVDNGGFFPEQASREDAAQFLMDQMKTLGFDAVGVGERDLRYGIAYLKSQAKRTGLPMVCANLIEKRTGRTLVAPSIIKRVGAVRVGVFGLISEKTALGTTSDSITILEPTAVAKQMSADLRKRGADVVVLLSQLGKEGSDDLVSAVDGIDAVVVGHDVPPIPSGRIIKNTVACYGGEQGQYMCQTMLTLDVKRHPASGEAQTVMLGPDIGERQDVLKQVKSFEDGYNERMKKENDARTARVEVKPAAAPADSIKSGDHHSTAP